MKMKAVCVEPALTAAPKRRFNTGLKKPNISNTEYLQYGGGMPYCVYVRQT